MFFLPNVKEHAPPLAGASDETGVEVHVTGDVDDRAASGGCCVSSCSPLVYFAFRSTFHTSPSAAFGFAGLVPCIEII